MALKECMNILLEDAKKQDALIEADITAYATMLSNIDIHSEKRKLYRDKYRTFVHQLMQISGRNTLNLSESGSIHVIELNKKQENEEDEIERNQQLIKEQKEYFKSITEKDYEKLWEMPDTISCVTKLLYPTIAKSFKTTNQKVERAIRNAIEVSWTRGNAETFEELFGYSVQQGRKRPTNSEYIAKIADKMRLDMKGL